MFFGNSEDKIDILIFCKLANGIDKIIQPDKVEFCFITGQYFFQFCSLYFCILLLLQRNDHCLRSPHVLPV